MPSLTAKRMLAIAACGGLVITPPAGGQPFQAVAFQPAPGSADSGDVHVNDSFEAADALTRAAALGDAGDWTGAARLLQGVSDAAGDKLIRTGPGVYTGVRNRLNDAIAAWPRAGLEAYRELYERDVEDALAGSEVDARIGDALETFDRYFCTDAAARLADVIGHRAIEAGDLQLAEAVYRRVQERHPDREKYASRDATMLALVTAMQGGSPDHSTIPEPEPLVRWGDRERPLGEVLQEIRDRFQTTPTPAAGEWPIFAGDAARGRRASTQVDEPGLLWRVDLLERPSGDAGDDEAELLGDGDRGRGRYVSIQPVVSGELVVAQCFREVFALNRQTGARVWRYRAGERATGSANLLDEQAPSWDSVTIRDGRVYAVIAGDPAPYYSYDSAKSPTEVVCLDLQTGRVLWRLDPESVHEAFAEMAFDSSPLVEHDRVLLVGRRRRSFGFEDCFLYCLDAASGVIRFRTHLGSASTGTFGSRQATKAVAAMDGDTVYVCSNLGTLAAVSAHTGAVRWLRLYGRRRGGSNGGRSVRDVRSWHFNPVIVSDGRLVVLPTDADELMVFSADDGLPVASVPVQDVGDMETLLGVRGDLACGVGERVACVDWNSGRPTWTADLPESERVFGRGIWADERLLVPTPRKLCSFQVSDGARTDAAWEIEGEGGNLVALPEQLFVAGAGRLSAYVRRGEIWQSLRDRMAASPSDPNPALDLAEVALNNAEFEQALTVLAEAVRRIDVVPDRDDRPAANRAFDDVLMFLDRLSARKALDVAALDTLHGFAARFTPDPAGGVRYRLRFAELYNNLEQPERAMRLYQQVLRDRSLRELPGDTAEGKTDTAAIRAQERIAALIQSSGRAIYEPFETEARQWLERDRAAADVAGLQRVVETFPNSAAAPRALIAQGEILAAKGQAKDAARRFSAAYHHYADEVDRAELLRKIADAYESAGALEHAWRWLTKAAREHPSVRIGYNGRTVGFIEYRERLAGVRERVEPSRSDTVPPLTERFALDLDPSAALLTPRFGDEPGSRWSRFFVQTPVGIRAYDARTGRESWPGPAPAAGRAQLLVATGTLAVFATPYEVFALDIVTGSRRWSHGEYPANVEGVDVDWEDTSVFRHFALRGARLIVSRDDGRLDALSLDTGLLQWSETRKPSPAGPIRLSDSLVVYHFVQDQAPVICLVDAAGGTWIDAIVVEAKAAVEGIYITLDDQIIVATTGGILAFDADTRRLRWRVSVQGQLRRESLALDVDALYFSDDGRRVRKINLEDGATAWESEPLVPRSDDDLTVDLQDVGVLVSSSTTVSGVDAVNGLTLWRGTTTDDPRFVARTLARAYFIAIDQPREAREATATAYFYDHRNGSGAIARDGGALGLGPLGDVRTVLALDGGLVVQSGSALMGWGKQ